MSRPILYSDEVSPPCRGVLLAIEALGLDVEIRNVNLFERENLKEEFIKINPQHTVPTLDDNGFIIWDSHAIMCYLADKYGKDDSLFPKDLQKRALINQRLHFDSGILFALLRGLGFPVFFRGKKTLDPERIELLKDAYDFLNKFLEEKKWLIDGDNYTLADISCVSTLSSLADAFHPIDEYPNVIRWLKTCEKELPGYEKLNAPGSKILSEALKKLLS